MRVDARRHVAAKIDGLAHGGRVRPVAEVASRAAADARVPRRVAGVCAAVLHVVEGGVAPREGVLAVAAVGQLLDARLDVGVKEGLVGESLATAKGKRGG